MSDTPSLVTGAFTASAMLIDCNIVKRRKLELELSSPADLVKLLGPRALDESLAYVPLNTMPARSAEESQANRYSAPDGPSRRRRVNDGSEPLAHTGYEAVAQFLSASESIRELKSVTALAAYLEVARPTIYRWMKDREVLRRADWLTRGDVMLGAIIARRELSEIVENVAAKAKGGNLRAVKLFLEIFSELETGPHASSSQIYALSATEILRMTDNSGESPMSVEEINAAAESNRDRAQNR